MPAPNLPLDRLIAFRDHILATTPGMTMHSFEQACGLSNGFFKTRKVEKSRGLSVESILRIKQAFPALNTEWVLHGTGHMLTTKEGNPFYNAAFSTLPLQAPKDGSVCCDIIATPQDYYHLPRLTAEGNLFCLADDPAMHPTIPTGTIICLKPANPKSFPASCLGHPFAVALKDGARILRYISSSSPRVIHLTAANPSPAYASIQVQRSNITHLFQIIALVTFP